MLASVLQAVVSGPTLLTMYQLYATMKNCLVTSFNYTSDTGSAPGISIS